MRGSLATVPWHSEIVVSWLLLLLLLLCLLLLLLPLQSRIFNYCMDIVPTFSRSRRLWRKLQ